MSFLSISISYIVYCQLDQGADFMLQKAQYDAASKLSVKAQACKRTQHCWPTTPNIVGPNNVVTCCVRLHGITTMLALVAHSLKPVKHLGQCKRTQHCWPTTPNNVGSCWHLLRPFARAFRSSSTVYFPIIKSHHPVLEEKTR